MTAYLRTSNIVTIWFLLAMAWHFATVFGIFGTGPLEQSEMFVRIGLIVGSTIAVALATSTIQTKRHGDFAPDEREEKIERISEGIGVLTIYIGLTALCWFAFAPLTPAQIVNGILAVVAITELVKLLVVYFLHGRELV